MDSCPKLGTEGALYHGLGSAEQSRARTRKQGVPRRLQLPLELETESFGKSCFPPGCSFYLEFSEHGQFRLLLKACWIDFELGLGVSRGMQNCREECSVLDECLLCAVACGLDLPLTV